MEDKAYENEIIQAAKDKLKSAKKPLSDLELIRGIVHNLKVKLGNDDQRHSSKGRFRRDSFRFIIESNDWKNSIFQLENKKFVLADEYQFEKDKLKIDKEWHWENVDKNTAKANILSILQKINPTKFEFLVRDIVQKLFPIYTFTVTVSTGDKGIDIIGTKPDLNHNGKNEVIYIQVKRFVGTIGRPEADKFVGAVSDLIHKREDWSKFEGLFITTGRFPQSFLDKLCDSSKTGVTFSCWDGVEFTNKFMNLGLGIKYSIDLDYWKLVDSSIIPKEKK